MALITTEARNELIALYVGMFDAAPTSTKLSEMMAAREAGQTALQVATTLATDASFGTVYPGFLTGQEFADRLVANLLGDDVAGTSTTGPKGWATNWVLSALNSGKSRAEVILTSVQAIAATPNTAYTAAKATLENKVEVGAYYAITAQQNGTLAERTNILSTVTSSQATADAAIVVITNASQSFTVTAGATSVNEGGTATFSVASTGVTEGSDISYTISGVSAADVTSGSLTGTTKAGAGGAATISIGLVNDLSTEGAETLSVKVGSSTASTTVNDTSLSPVYTVTAGAATVNEGASATFTVTADSAITGTAAVTVTGISAADAASIPTTVEIVNGTGTVTIALTNDVTTEGAETISVKVGDSTATTSVTDTSLTPALNTDAVAGTIVSGQGTAIITPASLIANDIGSDGKALTGTPTLVAGSATNGEVLTSKDGNFVFLANAGARTGSFEYEVAGVAGKGTVNVTLNSAPTVAADAISGNEDDDIAGTVVATDADSDTLTYSYSAKNGTVTAGTGGAFTYKGNSNFNGADTVTVSVNDGYTTVTKDVTVTVAAVADPPAAVSPAPSAISANSGSTVTVDLTKYATDVDSGTLTYTADAAATTKGGTVAITGSTATITYAQGGGSAAIGADSFKFTATDGTTPVAGVNVDLTVVNTAPTATSFALTAKTGVTQTVDMTGKSTDAEGNTLTPTVVVGSVSNGGSAEVSNGQIIYTSTIGYTGTETVKYTVSDGFGGTSSEQTITFTVASNTGGTSGNDQLYGSTAAEAIDGLAGNDTINGGGGADTISGGDGNDQMTFNDNAKQILGGNGTDTLVLNADAIASSFNLSLTTNQNTDAQSTTTIVRGIENIDGSKSSNGITLAAVSADTTSLVLSGQADTITTLAAVTGTGVVINTGSGNDTITIGAATGTLNIDAGAGVDTIDASAATTNNTITGGDGNDTIKFAEATLSSGDAVTGGEGTDTLEMTDAAAITDEELTNFTTVETIKLTYSGSASTAQTIALGAEALGAGIVTVNATVATGDVTVTAAAAYTGNLTVLASANDVSVTGSTGSDTLVSNATYQLDTTATTNDSFAGGTGTDAVRLDNDAGTDGTGNAVTMTVGAGLASGVEQINISDIATDNSAGDVTINFVAGYAQTTGLTINGSALDAGESLVVDVAANTGSETVTITGGAGTDTFTLSAIADSVDGGTGADTFKFAEANLASSDSVTGGEGTDILEMTDAAGITDGELTNFTTVETIKLAAGAASQSVALGAEALGAGIVTVNATASAQDVTVTVAAGYTGNLTVLATSADNSITGGSGDDVLVSNAAAQLDTTATTNDSFAGGTGSDTIRMDNDRTDGTALTMTAGAGIVSGVEKITINDTATDNALGDVTINFVAGYAQTTGLTIDGTALDAGEVLTVDVAANAGSENVTIKGGAGADVFTLSAIADSVDGGTGADTFKFAEANLASSDSVTGGEGTDILEMTNAADITDAELTNFTTVETIKLAAGGATQSVALGAEALGAGIVTVNATAATGADVTVTVAAGYTGNLTVLATSADNSITGGSGDDVLVSNAAAQLDTTATTNDSFAGGTGSDTIRMDNDRTDGTALTMTAGAGIVSGVEKITINDTATDNAFGDVTINFVAGYAQTTGLTIDGTALDAGEVLTVDLAANAGSETVTVTGGAGNDVFTLSGIADSIDGGEGNDTFSVAVANLASSDSIVGGGGSTDTLALTTAADVSDALFTNLSGLERLSLTSGAATYVLGAQAVEAGLSTVAAAGTGDTTVTINAAGTTSAISISVSGGASSDDTAFNIYGGSGNDTINLDGSYGTGVDFVQGGSGADTITLGSSASATSADTIRISISGDLASGTTVTSADTYNAFSDGADLVEFVGGTLANGGGGQVVLSTGADDLNTGSDVYTATTLAELTTFNSGSVSSAYVLVLDDAAPFGANGFTGGSSAATAQGAVNAVVTYLTGNGIAGATVANINMFIVATVDTDDSGAANGVAVFQYQEGTLDAGIQSSELTLVGIFNGVDVDNLTIADFK